MPQARRVLCVTGDRDVADHVRAALDDVGPQVALDWRADAAIGEVGMYAVAVVTDVENGDPRDVVADIHAESPGLPILVAAREGGGELASDVLVAGATSYVPLDDATRLRDRLERLLSPDGDVERFLDRLVEHVGVGVGAYGRDGAITYTNPAFAALLDRSTEEVRGSPIWSVNPELDGSRFEDYFDSFAPGETRHADTTHVRADGTELPIHTVTTRVDHGGTPLHVGTIMDVSERVETQRKIEALHDVASALAEPDTVEGIHELVVDAADRILDLHACYFIEHREDHFAVTAASDVAPVEESTIPEETGVVWATYDGGEPMLIDDVHGHETAEPASDRFQSAVSIPVGEYGVFQAVSTETSAFTEEDLELANLLATHASAALDRVHFAATVRNERDRLAALFENVPNPVVEYEVDRDESTIIATDVNPAFEDIFGYDSMDIVGLDLDDVIVPPEGEERARALNQDLFQGRNVTAEVKRVTADGTRDFLLDVVPLDDTERDGGGYAIYTDITEQKQRERQLERQNDRLEEFASVVSHDLRNPLNVAAGRLELAARTAEGPTAEQVSHARTAIDRMDDLIADLLRLAREGRSLGATDPVDLAALARRAWSSVDTGDATLVVNDPPTVDADDDRVRQLFENLFRNSVEHGSTDDGDASRFDDNEHDGSNVTVTVEGTSDGFVVRDDGPGIPEEEHKRVFTSGFTTSDEGTGFGLSIVERIAGAHGWNIELDEGPDGGAAFVFHVSDAG